MPGLEALKSIASTNARWLLVTHQHPDTDAWVCMWAADKFVVPANDHREYRFVRAGDALTEEEYSGYKVLHMDTGGGAFDQHNRQLHRTSSFAMMAHTYGLDKDPGLRDIIELTIATDNVEPVPSTSVHYVFKGLPHLLQNSETKEVDWSEAFGRVCELLDILYGQAVDKERKVDEYRRNGRVDTLKNGIRVASLWWKPQWREAAFADGVQVVMWCAGRASRINYGIQVNRNSNFALKKVIVALRHAEAAKRGVVLTDEQAGQYRAPEGVPGWYYHDSGKLIVCGSRSHPLEGDEFSKLEPKEVITILKSVLGKLNTR